MDFRDRLQHWIGKRYSNVNQAAAQLAVKRQNIDNYLNADPRTGKIVQPSTPFLEKLAQDGCDMNWLLGGGVNVSEKLLDEIETIRRELEDVKRERDKLARIMGQIITQAHEAGIDYKAKPTK